MPPGSGQVRLDDLLRVCSSGDGLNRELLKEMLGLFIDENERRIDSAIVAAEAGDATTLRGVVHALKGSAALVGAERLHNLAGDCELRILGGTIRNPQVSARQLRDEYTAVVATLRSLYPDLGERDEPRRSRPD